jgi:hypothetical protein
MSARRCSQCGATVEVDDKAYASTCAFCDSALVDAEAQTSAPVDRVVPFTLDRARSGVLLKEWLAGNWLASESLRKALRPDELRPVFIPFYAYDATARSSYSCRVGVHWYRTETYTTTVNGKTVIRTRQVQETEWSPLAGSYVAQWFDHLVSASKGLPEFEANQLEPFDLGRAVPFAPEQTAGLASEIPTVPHDEALTVARQEVDQLQRGRIERSHLPGDTFSDLRTATELDVGRVQLLLLPVWIAVYAGPKGPVRVLVNGQTGEVVGAIPRSPWKVGCLVAVALSILGAFVMVALASSGVAIGFLSK